MQFSSKLNSLRFQSLFSATTYCSICIVLKKPLNTANKTSTHQLIRKAGLGGFLIIPHVKQNMQKQSI